MDREPNLPAPPAPSSGKSGLQINHPQFNLYRSFTSTSSSSSSSFSSSSLPALLRHVQAAFKRHRPLGSMQSTSIRPRRSVVPQREISKSTVSNAAFAMEPKKTEAEACRNQCNRAVDFVAQTLDAVTVNEIQVDASVTPPSISGTMTSMYEDGFSAYDVQEDLHRSLAGYKNNDAISSLTVESQDVPLVDGVKKVQFSLGSTSRFQEIEYVSSNQTDAVTAVSHELKHQNFKNLVVDTSLKSDAVNSLLLGKRTTELQDQLYHPMTQSSAIGSSCATTTLTNSTSAPLLNSTTYYPRPQLNSGPNAVVESIKECVVISKPMCQGKIVHHSSNCNSRMSVDQTLNEGQTASSKVGVHMEVKEYDTCKQQQGSVPKENGISKDPSPIDDKFAEGKELAGGITNIQSQDQLSKNSSSDVKIEPSKSEKQDKVPSSKAAPASRKKSYDPDLFFKVNGKLYQRLGKIGSGGSSEVHKVISSDCTIYALKKIKLKGRDYATAYGFCQEIEYLNKLKGKNNIIQLIDYEVTDKTLLQEVMSGLMNKDGRVKEDSYIYMVLEYGEIDLAHMLSQKWKEMEGTNSTIDENWLRFYWQQILQAVNTIHEERIVHSDLKPANFLLVRGALKLIDFGIAKAIMSDTTNIQRDSQVGTLSYMSPEAFMCNETDAKGNIIKCGRPSDIWSLGCILYQMVYGRTPFSEYKTFWAKFKVITDPNHEIIYEPVSNPWLLDIMKKCLAWDRNERWRIPQLLQHPFLVPPTPHQLTPCYENQSCKLLRLIAESCGNNQKALALCCQLQQLLKDPWSVITSPASTPLDQQLLFLHKMSNICFELQEQLQD